MVIEIEKIFLKSMKTTISRLGKDTETTECTRKNRHDNVVN